MVFLTYERDLVNIYLENHITVASLNKTESYIQENVEVE